MTELLHRAPMPLSAFRPHHSLSSPLQQLPYLSPPLRPSDPLPAPARKHSTGTELPWPRCLNKDAGQRACSNSFSARTPPYAARYNTAGGKTMTGFTHGPGLAQASSNGNTLKSLYQGQTSNRNGVNAPNSAPEASGGHTASETDHETGMAAEQIVSYLQIPASINNSKGSLSELVAQLTCLFWFESSATLLGVAEPSSTPITMQPLAANAQPRMAFRKWVTTLLSTTQVSQNVILLALLFIYRLKTQYPSLMGDKGSEYRLLTVALMLGNKFLDDNTYTNKTWADVSGMSVSEVHEMEVEFLSHLRYNLFVSAEDWNRWHRKLSRFYDYFERASKATALAAPAMAPNTQPTMLTPPVSQQTSPYFPTTAPSNGGTPGSLSLAPYLPPTIPSPISRLPDVDPLRSAQHGRKRSRDESAYGGAYGEPTAKRVPSRLSSSIASHDSWSPAYSTPASTVSTPSSLAPRQSAPPQPYPSLAQLQHPPPQLPMPAGSAGPPPGRAHPTAASHAGPYSAPLPPPMVGRAMASVYGPPARDSSPAHHLTPGTQPPSHPSFGTTPLNIRIPPVGEHYLMRPTPPPSTASLSSAALSSAYPPYAAPPSYPASSSRGSSPTAALTPTSTAYTPAYTPASAQHAPYPGPHHPQAGTPQPHDSNLSPAQHAFAHRSSPYRPVRGVHTLLVPPPPASVHTPGQGHPAPALVPHAQMRYLPLGKGARDPRCGVVPLVGAGEAAWASGRGGWYQADAGRR